MFDASPCDVDRGAKKQTIKLVSINNGAMTQAAPPGKLAFNIFSALAQFERQLVQERTRDVLAAARVRGRRGGRPPMAVDEPRVVLAQDLHTDKSISVNDICQMLKISRATLYRYLRMGKKTTHES